MSISVRIVISILIILAFSGMSSGITGKTGNDAEIKSLWLECKLDKLLSYDIFRKAVDGYRLTDNVRKKNIFTIIDFSKPSTEKRCFVIDIDNRKLLYHCLVAHGRNSGDNTADSFSNKPESLKSSLGFYLTAETYSGKHGYSLRLDGLEKNINDNARSREIVIHGADYVSQEFIDKYGRLGRSWGCPALPTEITKEVIDRISKGSCLFIYGKDDSYPEHSAFIKNK
ncbi:MAG: murein L,D-transpeptidase catalytic domain family protein [Bacteroidales bacterium]|nr:murein L,D-transpeptidase catalytic domain family protein [Bacteroidales bacterium]